MSAATWILCSKIFLILTGAVSIAMAIKFSVPSIMAFAFYEVPTIWSTLVCWLKPPYIYFIVNGIIITIVASSRFSRKPESSENSPQTQPLVAARTIPPAHSVAANIAPRPIPAINVVEAPPEVAYEDEDDSEYNIVELKPVVVNGIIEAVENEAYHGVSVCSPPEADEANDGDLVVCESAYTSPHKIISPEPQLDYFPLPVEKKPLLPSRYGQRRPIKVVPEGGNTVSVARPKRHETLESTWKMIMEGRERQLKKSDTFEDRGRQLDDVNVSEEDDHLLPQHVLKSATFRDRTNDDDAPPVPALGWSSNMGKIKRDLSLSQDELNRRVEAFIKKFNEEMRLQRQESINQYMEMINRGAN